VFSPDGQWLAFVRSFRRGVTELHILPLKDAIHPAGPPRRLTYDICAVQDPAWSSDSRSIVFTSDRQGNRRLWRVSAFGPSLTPQLLGGENAQAPSLDPLGQAAILGPDGRLGHLERLAWVPRLVRAS
jgi:Tol biopolymer transport system component